MSEVKRKQLRAWCKWIQTGPEHESVRFEHLRQAGSAIEEALDTIERYEKALQNIQFVCTKGTATIFPRDTIETCAARAREALNPEEKE